MEMRFIVGGAPAPAMKTGLEQRQRKRDGDDPGSEPERRIDMGFAGQRDAPGDPAHDQRHDGGKGERLFPAAAIDGESESERPEGQSSGQRGTPRRPHIRIPFGKEIYTEARQPQEGGKAPRAKRPVGMEGGRMRIAGLAHATSPVSIIRRAAAPAGRVRPAGPAAAGPSSAGAHWHGPGNRPGS